MIIANLNLLKSDDFFKKYIIKPIHSVFSSIASVPVLLGAVSAVVSRAAFETMPAASSAMAIGVVVVSSLAAQSVQRQLEEKQLEKTPQIEEEADSNSDSDSPLVSDNDSADDISEIDILQEKYNLSETDVKLKDKMLRKMGKRLAALQSQILVLKAIFLPKLELEKTILEAEILSVKNQIEARSLDSRSYIDGFKVMLVKLQGQLKILENTIMQFNIEHELLS